MKKNCNESCFFLIVEFYDCCDMYYMKFIIMRVIVLYIWISIISNCCDKYMYVLLFFLDSNFYFG